MFIFFLPVILLSLALITGCGAYAVTPVLGVLYTDIKAPVTATSHPTYSKVGTASCTSILGLIATGDASIEAACKSVGITKIHHVDFHSNNILGIVATYKIYVYGD
ncbi:MAG: TRL-like family protein [Candidatus Kapaibacteriota bacterium]